MLHFYEVNFGIKKRYVSFCHYEGGPLNRKVVTRLTLSFLNLMLMYIFSRILGKHKSTLKFFNIHLDGKDFKQSIN